MEVTSGTLLLDAGIIGALLVISAGLRAWVSLLRALMVPSSVIGGFIGLALGPSGLGILPFSEFFGDYPSVLVVIVFMCLAMTADLKLEKFRSPLGQFFRYTILMYSVQIFIGLLLTLLLLGPVFGTPDAFGVVLFAGWAGGFGTAVAFGQVFGEAGQQEIADLAFTLATVGLLAGIVGGLIVAKIGAERGHPKVFAGLSSIPEDARTGVLKKDSERPVIGHYVFSGASVESLAFQGGIVVAISAVAYLAQLWFKATFPSVTVPVFSLAFIFGLLVNLPFQKMKGAMLIDKPSINSISGAATDVLILCGIASVKPSVVLDHLVPLLILFAVGLAVVLFVGLVIAPRVLQENWFEKQIFSFG